MYAILINEGCLIPAIANLCRGKRLKVVERDDKFYVQLDGWFFGTSGRMYKECLAYDDCFVIIRGICCTREFVTARLP